MKKIGMIAVVALFVGCGGSGGSSSSVSTYDLADYLITSNTSLKNWDSYKVENDTVTDTLGIFLKTTELHFGDVREIPSIGTFYLVEDKISLGTKSSSSKYDRNIKVGDTWIKGCKWKSHSASFSLKNNETYEDVLELSCARYNFYFSKGKGNVGKIGNTVGQEVFHLMLSSIEIRNLTVGEITKNDNKYFRLD
jgi:hypothetical protein